MANKYGLEDSWDNPVWDEMRYTTVAQIDYGRGRRLSDDIARSLANRIRRTQVPILLEVETVMEARIEYFNTEIWERLFTVSEEERDRIVNGYGKGSFANGEW